MLEKRGIRYVHKSFQDADQVLWYQDRLWYAHNQAEHYVDALGYANRLHVPNDLGHDCNQLLVNLFGHLRSVAMHQRTVQMLQTQEIRKAGDLPPAYFLCGGSGNGIQWVILSGG